jgi:hypothetical protein
MLVVSAVPAPPASSGALSKAPASRVAAQSDAAAQSNSTAQDKAAAPERTLKQWKTDVTAALRQTAVLKDEDLESAAQTLIPLYQGLSSDTKLARPDREALRLQVRERLLTIQGKVLAHIQMQNAILAQQLPGGKTNSDTAAVADQGQQLLDALKQIHPDSWVERGGNGSAVLFPGGGNLGGTNLAGGKLGGFGGILAQQGVNGAGGAFGKGANGNRGANAKAGGAAVDHSQELVDLIQAVIVPQSWDAAGGQGTIRYWAPGGALIIRQTEEGHAEMTDLLKQLRKN